MSRYRTHVLVLTATILISATVHATVPYGLGYSGYLTDNGDPLDATVDVVFEIYDDQSGGTLQWTEAHDDIAVVGGTFSVVLGEADQTLTDLFDGGDYWLLVTIGEEPMLPRTRVNPVPYAFRAEESV